MLGLSRGELIERLGKPDSIDGGGKLNWFLGEQSDGGYTVPYRYFFVVELNEGNFCKSVQIENFD